MEIVILDGYTAAKDDLSFDFLKEFGHVDYYDRTAKEDVVSRIGDAQIVLTNKVVIDKAVMDACSNLKYIGVLATGYNVVDVAYAKEKNIIVTNIPAYSTASVAQHTVALLLEVCTHVGAHSEGISKGEWEESADFCYWNYPLIELAGKTAGIIGYGAIGSQVGSILQAMGMKVLYYNRHRKIELENAKVQYADLDTLFRDSDVISLHCPLNDENAGIICKENLEKMKKNAILINTARGGLVVEEDLAAALNNGQIYGAGLDVVSAEPMKKDNPLLGAKNCIITPHIAWASFEARSRLMRIEEANVRAFLEGDPINVVNK